MCLESNWIILFLFPAIRTVEGHKSVAGQNGISKGDDIITHDKILASPLSFQDEKKVSQSFSSNFPYFVRIMKSFNVRGSYTLVSQPPTTQKRKKSGNEDEKKTFSFMMIVKQLAFI